MRKRPRVTGTGGVGGDECNPFLAWRRRSSSGDFLRSHDDLRQLVDARAQGRVTTVNLEHMYWMRYDAEFVTAFQEADWVTADGWPLVVLARPAGVTRVTGNQLCASLTRGGQLKPLRYALLGSDDDTCDAFAALCAAAGHARVLCWHGRLEDMLLREVTQQAREEAVDLLLLSLDAKRGEVTAHALRGGGAPGMILNVGGGVGMAVGTTPAAPSVFERVGLEWLYRLVREPCRLARRYLVRYPSLVPSLLRALLTWSREERRP